MAPPRPAGLGHTDLEVSIRLARKDEAQALSDLALASKAHWGYDAEFLERTERALTVHAIELARGRTFVAESGATRAGFYGFEYEPPVLGLDFMFVAPAFIGRGVGAALMAHAKGEARRLGAHTLRIESDPNAEGFYLRMGARRVGEKPVPEIPGRALPVFEIKL